MSKKILRLSVAAILLAGLGLSASAAPGKASEVVAKPAKTKQIKTKQIKTKQIKAKPDTAKASAVGANASAKRALKTARITKPVRAVAASQSALSGTSPVAKAQPLAEKEYLKQKSCLVSALLNEASQEGEAGMTAVASVIVNRVGLKQFAGSICGVVYQPNQFYWTKRPINMRLVSASDKVLAEKIAKDMIAGNVVDTTDGALYFVGKTDNTGWINPNKLEQTVEIGGHRFFAPRRVRPASVEAAAPALTTPTVVPVAITATTDSAIPREETAAPEFSDPRDLSRKIQEF
jgi:spore germination cell wall hydrolase CwlJ-like protein